MRWIIGSSIKLRLLVMAVAVALIGVGVAQLRSMPVDVLPEFAPPIVEVQTEALGLSAAEVESLVTLNLEELLNGTPWLQSITSRSVPGLSDITLRFEPGTDVIRARQLVQERLTVAFAIPNVAQPPTIMQPRSATNRVMMVGISSASVSPIRMGVLARWTIRPALLSVPGVANVAIWGQRERQLQVRVDPQRLADRNVSLDQIVQTAGNAMWVSPLSFLEASTPGTGGWIDTPQQRLEVRHVFPISTAGDLGKVRVEDAAMRLRDVAAVVEDHQPLIGDALLPDQPNLTLVVEKFPKANTLEVTRGIEAKLAELQPALGAIRVDTSVFRPAAYVEQSIDNLRLAVVVGAVLAALALALLLLDPRRALVAVLVIAASLSAAVLVLHARGETLNAMALTGLVVALALLVDDAVVDVDQVARRLSADADGGDGSPIAAALLEVRGPLVFGAVIALVPLVAVFFVGGVEGRLLSPLALSYTLAVGASMLLALALTPALSMLLLSGHGRRDPAFLRRLARWYAAVLDRVLLRPGAVAAGAAAAALAAAALLPVLGQSLLPSLKDPDVEIRFDGPPGASQGEMARISRRATHELRSIAGVEEAGAEVGRASLGDQVVDTNSTRLFARVGSGDYDATVARIQEAVDGYPGIRNDVQPYVQGRVDQALTEPGRPITVKVFGPNFGVLYRTARHVATAVAGVEGVAHVTIERPPDEPYVEIEVDLARADRYGLKPGDVRRQAATLLAGLEVGSLFQEQKVFQVVVWTTPDARASLTSIRNLLIDAPDGGQVRLSRVADVRIARSPTVIEREAVSRRVVIGVGVRGRDAGAVQRDIARRLAGMPMPFEYHAEVSGSAGGGRTAERTALAVGIAVALAVFLLLQAAFGSWRLATLLFLTLPLALAGGVLAALVAGDDLTLASGLAFVAVLGVAARGGIGLLSHLQRLEREGGDAWGRALVARGASERLPAVAATTLAACLATTPLIATGSRAGQEVAHPAAVVLLGGLIGAALLNLFVLPAVYLRFGRPRPAAATRPEDA
jgi:CzcA family heavy metal efflux pump